MVREDRSWRWLLVTSVGSERDYRYLWHVSIFFEDIGRIYSTIGNPIFCDVSFIERGNRAVVRAWLIFARPWRFLLGGIAAFNAVIAMLTSTRAAMLAFAAGVVVLGCGYVFGMNIRQSD